MGRMIEDLGQPIKQTVIDLTLTGTGMITLTIIGILYAKKLLRKEAPTKERGARTAE